jgi:hypothetical protein
VSSVPTVSARARILYAAVALQSFTAKELSDYTGIKLQTVRTQLLRDKDRFDSMGKDETGRKGGAYIRYTLKSEARALLLKESSEVREYLAARPIESGAQNEQNQRRLKVALDGLEDALNKAQAALEPSVRTRWQSRAEVLLRNAESAARFAGESPEYRERFDIARKRYTSMFSPIDSAAPEQAAELSSIAPPASADIEETKEDLQEWMGPRMAFADEAVNPTSASFEALIESALAALRGDTKENALFSPAALIRKSFGHAEPAQRRRIGDYISQRLARISPKEGKEFAALAVMAALFDGEQAPNILMGAVVNPFSLELSTLERSVTLHALARFARPLGVRLWKSAGSFAHALISRPDHHPHDFSILAPAAICADLADSRTVLHRFAERSFGGAGLVDIFPYASRQGPLMRNLAVALHHLNFRPLREEWRALMSHDYGVAFIRALTNPSFHAIHLQDGNETGAYRIRLSNLLCKRLRIAISEPVMLPIEQDSPESDEMYNMIADHSPTYGPATHESTESGFDALLGPSLQQQLAQAKTQKIQTIH